MKRHIFSLLFILPCFLICCIKINIGSTNDDKKITMEELDANYKKYWNTPIYSIANTAINEAYLSTAEKKVYYYLNLAHLNPQLFASTYVEGYQGVNGYSNESDFGTNKKSLINDLNNLSQLPLLLPDTSMYNLAKCHALGIGEKGLESHDRLLTGCPYGYNAECIDFGEHNSLDIVMSLLIDAGVPGLGHRKICLGNYKSIGISIQNHKVDKKCAVLDFLK